MTPAAKLSLRDVMKGYTTPQGFQCVLQQLDLDIRAGEFVCLVGPSGCGKTTLINLMAGFELPSSGTVTIDGAPVQGPHPDRIMLFQDYGLFPWRTVLGNLLFALQARGISRREAREQAMDALALVGLQQAADKHPHQLSGGMQQRVALARALAVQPSVLFLDEPFAALDAFTRMRLQDELLQIWEDRRPTVVFVTHDLDEAITLGQTVVLMAPDPGRIQKVLAIDLPYPRERTAGDFAAYRRDLFDQFHLVHTQQSSGSDFSI